MKHNLHYKNQALRSVLIIWLGLGLIHTSTAHLGWYPCETRPSVPPRIDWLVVFRHPIDHGLLWELFFERMMPPEAENLEVCYFTKN